MSGWGVQDRALLRLALTPICRHLPVFWANEPIHVHVQLCLRYLLVNVPKMLGGHRHLWVELFTSVHVGGGLVLVWCRLIILFWILHLWFFNMLDYWLLVDRLWGICVILIGILGLPNTHCVHVIHLLVGACWWVPLNHVNAPLLAVESPLGEVGRIHAYLLHSFHLLFTLCFPVPNIVRWLPWL